MYCFGERLPDPDLVRKFISYVINDENETEAFTPFGGQGIDVTPVIRSYILQQLLAIKERYSMSLHRIIALRKLTMSSALFTVVMQVSTYTNFKRNL